MNRFLYLFILLGLIAVLAVGSFAADQPKVKAQTESLDLVTEPQGALWSPPVEFPKAIGKKLGLLGTYQVGVSGPAHYATLNQAVADLMLNGVDGAVTFEFIDAAYPDSQVAFGAIAGASLTNTVTFKPAVGVSPYFKFYNRRANLTADVAALLFDGAGFITFDGENRMTIETDTVVGPWGGVLANRNVAWVRNGSNNITLKNFTAIGMRRSASTSFGLFYQFNTGYTNPNFNITYDNLTAYRGNAGFWITGASSATGAAPDNNVTIQNCKFGGAFSPDPALFQLNLAGIPVSSAFVTDMTVNNNIFDGVYATATVRGGQFTDNSVNLVVSNNIFRNITEATTGASTNSIRGIQIHGTAGLVGAVRSTMTFYNNMLYNCFNNVGSGTWGHGIIFFAGNPQGYDVKFYHNTLNVDLGNTNMGSGYAMNYNGAGGSNPGIVVDNVTALNNIFSIRRVSSGNAYIAAAYGPAVLGQLAMNSDYNVYYSNTAYIAIIPSSTPNSGWLTDNLQDWRDSAGYFCNGGVPVDVSSKLEDPLFKANDAHIKYLGYLSPAEAAGTSSVPAYITHDVDGQLRSGLTPVDIGADAFEAVPFNRDALPVSITAPYISGIQIDLPAYPTVKVKSNGIETFGIAARVRIVGPAPAITEVYNEVETTPAAAPYEVVTYTFTAAFTPTALGNYTMYLTTELVGDEEPLNDGPISRGLYVAPLVTVTTSYFENFDAPGKTEAGWNAAATLGNTQQWILGTPAKPTINAPYSAPNSWVTGPLNAVYIESWQAAVYSPFFDLGAMQRPIIRFAMAFMTEAEWDAVIFEYSLDGNATWVRADRPTAINWYNYAVGEDLIFGPPAWSGAFEDNPGGWRIATITLPEAAGQTNVRFRMRFGSDPVATDEGVAFDNFEILDGAILAGMKFLDVNKNEAKDQGEPGIEAWGINLTSNELPVPYLASTDANGNYQFTDNIVPGEYTLFENELVGWVQTFPTGLIKQHEVVVTTSGTYGDLDFGNYFTTASIAGLVYEDVNGNGAQDAGELGLEGWNVDLTGTMVNSATTNANGEYLFASLEPGDYNVAVVGKAGWNLTSTPASYDVTLLAADQNVIDRNFGEFKLATISGAVYLDFNRNGMIDVGEPGVNGVTVDLAASNPVNNQTAVTAGGGLYSFTSGIETYTETIVVPAGKYIVAPVSGNYAISVTGSGMVIANKDFGLSSADDAVKYRSFIHQEIMALDPKSLKPVKAIKKKAFQVEQIINLPALEGKTDLHIEFGGAVFTMDPLEKNGIPLVIPTDYTVTGAIDGKNKKFDFVFVAPLAGTDVITIHVYLKGSKPLKLKYYWTPYVKGEPKFALIPGDPKFELNQPRLPMPNYINLLAEVYPKGGLGMLVGTAHPEAPKDYGWLQMAVAKDIYKTLWDKTGYHDGTPRFFDVFTNNSKPLVKLQKSLPPTKHDNALLAEIIALKLAITASASGFTEDGGGFGELIYQDTGNVLNGKMVKEIADEASAAMTSKVGDAANYYAVIYDINRAFAGAFDSVSFAAKTVLTGTVALGEVPFLRAPVTLIARNTPTGQKYADVPDVFELQQNYPNPFNPTTTISFILPEDAIVTLKIYNTIGQEVATLANKELYTEGMNELEFDASRLSSGIYFYQMTANGVGENAGKFSTVKKMVLMK